MYINPILEIDAGLGSYAEKVAGNDVVKAKLVTYLGDKLTRAYFCTERSVQDDRSEDVRLLSFYSTVVSRGIHMARMGTITESMIRSTHEEFASRAKRDDISSGPNEVLLETGVCFYLQDLLPGTMRAQVWIDEFDMLHNHELI